MSGYRLCPLPKSLTSHRYQTVLRSFRRYIHPKCQRLARKTREGEQQAFTNHLRAYLAESALIELFLQPGAQPHTHQALNFVSQKHSVQWVKYTADGNISDHIG